MPAKPLPRLTNRLDQRLPDRLANRLTDRLADRAGGAWFRVRRAVLIRRRRLAFLCVGVAVWAGLHAAAPPATPTVPVTVAARDLPAGAALRAGDLRVVGYAPGTAPDHLARDPVGRTVAAPVRRGEPVTDVRLVGPALNAGRSDLATVPVRLSDAAMAGLLRVGDEIDVLAADPEGGPASVVARRCLVLALPSPGAGDATADGQGGRLVVLGVPRSSVTSVSGVSVSHFLTFVYSA